MDLIKDIKIGNVRRLFFYKYCILINVILYKNYEKVFS